MRRNNFLAFLNKAKNEGRDFLFEYESKSILKEYGIPTTKFYLVKNEQEIEKIINELNFPCVAKITSPKAIHKSEIGGVILGINGKDELIKAYKKLTDIAQEKSIPLEGILIEEQSEPGIEAIIGVIKDPVFGHVIMFGTGGIYTEAFKDVSFKVLPVNKKDLFELIDETKLGLILKNSRGKKYDLNILIENLEKVVSLVEENPEIIEMDLNPVFIYESNIKVVDARIRFQVI
jgi:acyl-CoA synthetase (NDP forming)